MWFSPLFYLYFIHNVIVTIQKKKMCFRHQFIPIGRVALKNRSLQLDTAFSWLVVWCLEKVASRPQCQDQVYQKFGKSNSKTGTNEVNIKQIGYFVRNFYLISWSYSAIKTWNKFQSATRNLNNFIS